MNAREHLLKFLASVYEGLETVIVKAAEENDTWTGVAANMIKHALSQAAQAAEAERLKMSGR